MPSITRHSHEGDISITQDVQRKKPCALQAPSIMPPNNNQESTTIVTGAALPDSRMTARNLSLHSPQSRVENPEEDDQPMSAIREAERGLVRFRNRFLRTGKKKIGVRESLRAIALSSCALTIP